MERTQIYLTKSQRDELATMAKSAGKKQSELIREAVDLFINQYGNSHRNAILKEAAGMWKNRNDILDFKSVRSQWVRD